MKCSYMFAFAGWMLAVGAGAFAPGATAHALTVTYPASSCQALGPSETAQHSLGLFNTAPTSAGATVVFECPIVDYLDSSLLLEHGEVRRVELFAYDNNATKDVSVSFCVRNPATNTTSCLGTSTTGSPGFTSIVVSAASSTLYYWRHASNKTHLATVQVSMPPGATANRFIGFRISDEP